MPCYCTPAQVKRWKELAEIEKIKHAHNRKHAPIILQKAKIHFVIRNSGILLIVQGPNDCIIDFWPGSGNYKIRHTGRKGRGINRLIKLCQSRNTSDSLKMNYFTWKSG